MPSLDVIIPCYNYAALLPQCVASILAHDILTRSLDKLRIVIIDNASSDNSVEVARTLAESNPRIQLICHEKNLGPHASFNEAIDLAQADYFMILCADDLAAAHAISSGIQLLERFPNASFVLGTYVEFFSDKTPPEAQPQPSGYCLSNGDSFIERCCAGFEPVPAHAILVRTLTQKKIGHYRVSLPYMDDLEMVLRLATTGAVVEMDSPLAFRRIHSSNSLSESLWDQKLGLLKESEATFGSFFSNEGSEVPDAKRLHRIVRRKLAEVAYWSAASHLFKGKRAQARDLFNYCRGLDRSAIVFPPVSYLFRKPGAFKRVAAVIAHTLR
ncbi:glycosyltransferase family A protein [Mesorhizobium sp. B2-8-9]|uniref:glycosyltransferase family 2 protein n=1 Tax=Mesorhizobium sp. B2-8-9 TaxID=2589899 RepID=UPI001127512C|nr:glycosyltransferase family A protein [Mesorhizobium sp. B2-8-9]TPI81978.1 glycosyltransferase family 2 protein [Mesorhizobium sp. B2-8-9]